MFAAFTSCAHAQPGDAPSYNYVARARQFLRELYPDLTRQLYVTIRDHQPMDGSDMLALFDIELSKPKWMPGGAPPGAPPEVEPNICGEGCICENPVLHGNFGFSGQGEHREMFMAWMAGPYLTCRLDRLLQVVGRHPEWTNARILAELKSSGAKFGPDRKEELLRVLPIEKLRPFVGKMEVKSVEFQFPELIWLVRATWDGRSDASCTLMLEPFDGKLKQFNRSPIAPKEDAK